MKNLKHNQKGFAVVEFILIVMIVVVVSAIGFRISQKQSNKTAPVATTKPTTQSSTKSLPTQIQSSSDINSSVTTLNADPISTQLDETQFDSNISSLL